jgi:hypothetical protein
MFTDVDIVLDQPKQLAFSANPPVVRAFVPVGSVGVYMLLRDDEAFYVGRSDCCVQSRLTGHALLRQASHVTWEPCASPLHAYRLEAAWFHILSPTLLNRIHPARPVGWVHQCPFCGTRDCQALAQALRSPRRSSAAQTVVADQMAVTAKTQGA